MIVRSLGEINEALKGKVKISRCMHASPYDPWEYRINLEEKEIVFYYPWSSGSSFYIGYLRKTLLPVVSTLKEIGIIKDYKFYEEVVRDSGGAFIEDRSYFEVEFEESIDLSKISSEK